MFFEVIAICNCACTRHSFHSVYGQLVKSNLSDVGQGDSIVIELPYRQAVYVIDTGGTITFGEANWKTPTKQFEVGRKIVVPYLKGRGITTIDKLIFSHADADHMEGADEVLEEIRVAKFIFHLVVKRK